MTKERINASFVEIVLMILLSVAKRKRLVFLLTGLPTIISIVIVTIVNPKFRIDAVVSLPNKNELASLKNALDGNLFSLLGHGMSGSQDEGLILTILASHELHDDVIKQFDLTSHYEFKGKYHADLLRIFRRNFTYEVNDEEMLALSIKDENPELGVKILNYIIQKADSIYTTTRSVEAKIAKDFFEKRLNKSLVDLRKAEDSLAIFQRKNGIYSPDDQLESTIKFLSTLETDRQLLEIERNFEEQRHGKSSLKYKKLNEQVQSMRSALNKASKKQRKGSVVLPLEKSIDLALEYSRHMRELKVQSAIYKFIRQRYEENNLNEAKKIKNLIVIEKPWPNNKKVSPPKRAIVLGTFFAFGIISMLLCVLLEVLAEEIQKKGVVFKYLRELRESLFRFR